MFEVEIYPKFYYSRRFESDHAWVMRKMSYIPLDKQQEVSDRYEKLYLNGSDRNARKTANTYLHNVAKEYHLCLTKNTI